MDPRTLKLNPLGWVTYTIPQTAGRNMPAVAFKSPMEVLLKWQPSTRSQKRGLWAKSFFKGLCAFLFVVETTCKNAFFKEFL